MMTFGAHPDALLLKARQAQREEALRALDAAMSAPVGRERKPGGNCKPPVRSKPRQCIRCRTTYPQSRLHFKHHREKVCLACGERVNESRQRRWGRP